MELHDHAKDAKIVAFIVADVLNRPHPPHSQAHRDFTAWQLIRNAFAVRERLGDPRAVPGFRCPFLPDMPSSTTPGSPASIGSRTSMPARPSPSIERLGTPKTSANPFHAGNDFVASVVRTFATACQVARPPCTDLTSFPANGGLYFQAFDGSVTLPAAGYDYSIDWTPMLAGLSPAGLTASLAAPIPSIASYGSANLNISFRPQARFRPEIKQSK